jgi:hypothetical protein
MVQPSIYICDLSNIIMSESEIENKMWNKFEHAKWQGNETEILLVLERDD